MKGQLKGAFSLLALICSVQVATGAAQNYTVVTPEPVIEEQYLNAGRAVNPNEPYSPLADDKTGGRDPLSHTEPPKKPSTPADNQIGDFDDYLPSRNDHSDFDWRLTKAMTVNNPKNVIISPMSVKLLLTLLSEAAGDRTRTQMELSQVIPFGESHIQSREYFDKFFKSIKGKNNDWTLDMATKVFTDSFIVPNQRYSAILERYYATVVQTEDFSNGERVAQGINQWVANTTQNHITNLVKPDDVQNAVMLLLNAVYFKGLWRQPFFENQTFVSEFFSSEREKSNSQFMVQTGRFFYVESSTLNAKILRLPYKGRRFSMFLILPNAKGGFDEFVRGIDSQAIHNAKWYMDDVEVRVVIPKFKYDFSANLNEVLQGLGIQQVFTNEASLPLLSRGAGLDGRLKVSNVIQKAGLVVEERGSTAFAATEVSLVNKFGDDGVRDFVANRPFLFVIEDETNGAILFAGKVQNPSQM